MSAVVTNDDAAAAWMLSSSARTHIGLVRKVNEDRLLNRADKGLFAIADGMGGHSRGDVAADMVVQALARLVSGPEVVAADNLCLTICEANRRVYELDSRNAGQSGSTIAGMHIAGRQVFLFWAGDSRIYRLRQGQLQAMTRDHRVVQEMIDAGVLTDQSARDHPRASVITRAVGAQPELSLAVVHDVSKCGDVYLLCSDGLSDLVVPSTICRMLALPDNRAADALLEAAISAGGRDNISLIVVGIHRNSQAEVPQQGTATLHSDSAR